MMQTDNTAKLKHLETRMKQCELWANWHIASATTGVCKKRNIYQGDRKLTDEELVNRAMDTAKQHIQNYGEAMEEYISALHEHSQ